MQIELFNVPFYDDNITLVGEDGQPMIAVKPIVENMGLAWQVQQRNISEKFK